MPRQIPLIAGLTLAAVLASSPARAQCGAGTVSIRPHETVAFEGDSLTYGFDKTESGTRPAINASAFTRTTAPFPETVAGLLQNRVEVVNRGYPGDRSTDGWQRWAKAPRADVVVLMYGTNDAGNYGGHPSGPVRPDVFRATLERMIARRQAQGARVILITPPPVQNQQAEEAVMPFRQIVADVAMRRGTVLLDIEKLLTGKKSIWTDGLHLSTEANILIAKEVAKVICISQ